MATLPGSLGASRSPCVVASQLNGTQGANRFGNWKRYQFAEVGKTTSVAELQFLSRSANTVVFKRLFQQEQFQ